MDTETTTNDGDTIPRIAALQAAEGRYIVAVDAEIVTDSGSSETAVRVYQMLARYGKPGLRVALYERDGNGTIITHQTAHTT